VHIFCVLYSQTANHIATSVFLTQPQQNRDEFAVREVTREGKKYSAMPPCGVRVP
jgi:hypothetical protein